MLVRDHFLTGQVFSLVDCSNCGFRTTSPRPSQDRIGAYYKSDGYISHTGRRSSFQDRIYHQLRRWAISRKSGLVRRYQPNGHVLDIGCGTGEFLAHLRGRGYNVQGVEPDPGARAKAMSDHALPVVPSWGQLTHKEHYQVITLWHVLEHLPDPRATFKQLYALMADRGLLVIAVPDRESWDASHYGPWWAAWDVPRHLSHFRRQDIHKLIREHGFELVATKPMWLDACYIALLSEGYKGKRGPWAWSLAMLMGAWSNIMSVVTNRPTSSILYIARKAEP